MVRKSSQGSCQPETSVWKKAKKKSDPLTSEGVSKDDTGHVHYARVSPSFVEIFVAKEFLTSYYHC